MDLHGPDFSDSKDPIFSDSRDPLIILALLAIQLFSTVSNIFSKPSFIQILFSYFLVCVFSEDDVTAKT